MKDRTQLPRSTCPITVALDLFGDKWSLLILRDMVFKGKKHYREFLTSPEKISTNILADRLARMEDAKLLSKARDPDNQSKYVYRLTDKGKGLVPVLLELARWSATYEPQPNASERVISGAPDRLLQRMNMDRNRLIEEILEDL